MTRFILICLSALCFAGSAWAQGLSMDLSQDQIDITTGFNGAQVTVFGARHKPGMVAVKIVGPLREMVVRRKNNVGGIWMNTESMTFVDIPAYYDYALSPEGFLEKSQGILKEHGIGLRGLFFATDEDVRQEEIDIYRKALIRNMSAIGLYPEQPKSIEFVDDKLFKVSFYIPANVASGSYDVRAFLIDKGLVIDQRTESFRVGQVGFSARIYNIAQTWSVAYGVLCVIFALFMGWASNYLRRRA